MDRYKIKQEEGFFGLDSINGYLNKRRIISITMYQNKGPIIKISPYHNQDVEEYTKCIQATFGEYDKYTTKGMVEKVRNFLKSLDDHPNSAWGQGYCSALADHGIITNEQFNELVD